MSDDDCVRLRRRRTAVAAADAGLAAQPQRAVHRAGRRSCTQGLRDAAADAGGARGRARPHRRHVLRGRRPAARPAGARARRDVAVDRAREMTALLRAILELPDAGHRRRSTATSGPAGSAWSGACDIVVAGPRSTFALTEARIGVAPSIISLTLLPKMIAARGGPLLPHRREVRRRRGRRDRADHRRRRRRRRRAVAALVADIAQGLAAGPGRVEGADHGVDPRRTSTATPRR